MHDLEDRLRELGDRVSQEVPLEVRPTPTALRSIRTGRAVRSGAVVAAVATLVFGGFSATAMLRRDDTPAPPAEEAKQESAFVDTWVSTDIDGSKQTMVVRASDGDAYEIVVRDDSAGVCSGAPSTMTGTGRLDGGRKLVIPTPGFTCDDGSEPKVESGPPVDELLRNLTFVHDAEADNLTDNFDVVWGRDEIPESSGGMWPQSSLEEIREAQELADADDPRYTWQVDRHLAALTGPKAVEGGPYGAEIFTRFLREELGWQEFRGTPFVGSASSPGHHEGVTYVRCAPGRANPLYPTDPEGRDCAPTINELNYETVAIDVKQLARRGPTGVWVVTRWAELPPSDEPITPNSDLYGRQVEQVAPPSDAEVTDLVEAFLQARIDGEGAQKYVHSLYTPADEIPLLYATTSGSPYDRFEIGRVEGPDWPIGGLILEVRLFAEGGNTVVEQGFSLHREGDGRLGLQYAGEDTTENGEAVAEQSSILDGQVTYSVPTGWREISAVPELGYLQGGGRAFIEILPNSLPPDCDTEGPPPSAPPSAEAVVRAIRSDPDLEATAPVSARVGGVVALRLDVAADPGAAATCAGNAVPVAPSPYADPGWGLIVPGDLARLYVLDLPEPLRVTAGLLPAPARTLTILIAAPEDVFERTVASVGPILDSIEFHPE